MSNTNTGKQSGAPALPNNFQGNKPADAKAPGGIEGKVESNNRGNGQ